MVKPKRDLASDFAPRSAAPAASMREALPTAATASSSDPLKHLTIQVPESLRHRLKAAALEEKCSVRDLVTDALRNHLDTLGR